MSNAIRSLAVVSKRTDRAAATIAIRAAKTLKRSGLKVYLTSPLEAEGFEQLEAPLNLKSRGIDAVLAYGGDGTILRTARQINDETPILGVKVGARGILTELMPEALGESIERLKRGMYITERRFRIRAKMGNRRFPPALNEIYILRLKRIKTPTFTIRVSDGGELKQRMDGLLLSTSTGSTGHSLSFGSPVICDQLETVILTPVAPISRMPPIVLPPTKVTVTADQEFSVLIDGQIDFKIAAGDQIEVEKHETDSVFLRFSKSVLGQLSRLGF